MKYFQGFIPILIFCTVVTNIWVSCAGSPPAAPFTGAAQEDADEADEWFSVGDEYFPPPGMTFIPAEFPSLVLPPGVGIITTSGLDRAAALSETERTALSDSFRAAYISSRFRQAPLAGVLGGDFVHGWPPVNPYAWVQNWHSSAPQANSWGLPSLVLAIRGFREGREIEGRETGRVFIVQGKLLHQYGISGGINGANGIVGYGSPRGYEFLHEGKLAQRFDFGLITVDREGKGSFSPETPPSLGLVPPPDLGVFVGSPFSPHDVRPAFITAWQMALDRGIETMTPDGPGQFIAFFDSSWDFPGGQTLRGFYVQTFNERTILLVLPSSPMLPPYPRFIASPFLEALLSAPRHSLPGAEDLTPLDINFSGEDGFFRALARGLAMYGIPLTDPMPLAENGAAFWGESPASWMEAQRFSRGWLVKP